MKLSFPEQHHELILELVQQMASNEALTGLTNDISGIHTMGEKSPGQNVPTHVRIHCAEVDGQFDDFQPLDLTLLLLKRQSVPLRAGVLQLNRVIDLFHFVFADFLLCGQCFLLMPRALVRLGQYQLYRMHTSNDVDLRSVFVVVWR